MWSNRVLSRWSNSLLSFFIMGLDKECPLVDVKASVLCNVDHVQFGHSMHMSHFSITQ